MKANSKKIAARAAVPAEPAVVAAGAKWQLRLYVAGQTPRSVAALVNLRKLCEQHLAGEYAIEVIDLLKNPQLAKGDQIFALPTLVRRLPEPMKRIIGDLSNTEKFLVGLDLRKATAKTAAPATQRSGRQVPPGTGEADGETA